MKLKSGGWAHLARKHSLKVFDGVPQRVSLPAGRWWLFTAEPGAQIIQALAQLAPEAIHRFQREGQPEFFRGGLDGKPGQQFHQPGPHPRGGERVPWQHVRQQQGKGAPATAALAAIGTKYPLAADRVAGGLVGIVAVEEAVPVQGFDLIAAGTALLLEGKSASFSAGSSRTK